MNNDEETRYSLRLKDFKATSKYIRHRCSGKLSCLMTFDENNLVEDDDEHEEEQDKDNIITGQFSKVLRPISI